VRVLDSLFDLRRRQCAERRVYLVELNLLAQRLRTDAQRLYAEIERAFAAGDSVLSQSLNERLRKLEGSIATVKNQIVNANEALAAVEQELQRHQLASTRRLGNTGVAEQHRVRRSSRAGPAPSPIASPVDGPDRGS
jgi:septal ring factor EnvC (AmiA/AmiB activator)